jgi:hypothetical protein
MGKSYKVKMKGDRLVLTRKVGKKALYCSVLFFACFFVAMGLTMTIGASHASGNPETATQPSPSPSPIFERLCSRSCDSMPVCTHTCHSWMW